MKPTRKRLVGVAAALSAVAIAGPVSTSSAAVAPGIGTFPILATGWGGWPAATLPFGGPLVGQAAVVIGPTIITTAPSVFINTNNQVSAGSSLAGGQVAAP